MKRRNITAAVAVIALRIIVLAAIYFFVPVNPLISADITRSSPMEVLIFKKDENPKYVIAGTARFKNEDLSFFDRMIFMNMVARSVKTDMRFEPISSGMGKAPYRTIVVVRFPQGGEGVHAGDKTEIYFASTEKKYVCAAEASVCEKYLTEDKHLKLFMNIDCIYEKYYEKGFELKLKRTAEEQEQREKAYSDFMEQYASDET